MILLEQETSCKGACHYSESFLPPTLPGRHRVDDHNWRPFVWLFATNGGWSHIPSLGTVVRTECGVPLRIDYIAQTSVGTAVLWLVNDSTGKKYYSSGPGPVSESFIPVMRDYD